MRRTLVLALGTASLAFGSISTAQSIEIGQLGSAEAFDVGTLDVSNGGLDQNLWSKTSAIRATRLLERAPIQNRDPAVQSLMRAAVLSGGVPPRAGDPAMDAAFKVARLKTIMAIGEMSAAQDIMSRTPILSNDPLLKVEMSLRAGNDTAACTQVDTVLEDRALPKWARLRAYCHVVRDEIAAAELTADVLRAAEYNDVTFFNLMNRVSGGVGKPDFSSLSVSDPLHIALMNRADLKWPNETPRTALARRALNPLASPEDRLVALYGAGAALSDAQIGEIFTSLAARDDGLAGGAAPDFESAVKESVPRGTALLFEIAQSGLATDRPKALAELLKRARGAGAFDRFVGLMASPLQTFSAQEKITTDLKTFVGAAISRQDMSALRSIYAGLADKPEMQERVALISDALGYGFLGGDLGIDLETRLAGKDDIKARAQRDVFIALAMGAVLSDIAEADFSSADAGKGEAAAPGAIAALDAAARAGSKAETALRAATILSSATLDNQSLYAVIKALGDAGLSGFAGRVAAEDFLRDFPE